MKNKSSIYRTLRFIVYAVVVVTIGRLIAGYTPEFYDFTIGWLAGFLWLMVAFAIETKFFPEKDKETTEHVIKIQVDATDAIRSLKKITFEADQLQRTLQNVKLTKD